MILFLTVGLNLCVGALVWDIVNQPTFPFLLCIILFVLCGVILVSTTVILRWNIRYNYWRILCKRIDARKKAKELLDKFAYSNFQSGNINIFIDPAIEEEK